MNRIYLVKHDSKSVTTQIYAVLIMALLQLRLKQLSLDIYDNATSSQTDSVSSQADTQENEPEKRLSKQSFFETIGKNLYKYWKIGSHWLTAFKSLLAEPFDARAIAILCDT